VHDRDFYDLTHVLFIHKVSLGIKGPISTVRSKISPVAASALLLGETVKRLHL